MVVASLVGSVVPELLGAARAALMVALYPELGWGRVGKRTQNRAPSQAGRMPGRRIQGHAADGSETTLNRLHGYLRAFDISGPLQTQQTLGRCEGYFLPAANKNYQNLRCGFIFLWTAS